ncbi:hypothetical protein F5884DRAFT_858761 [Xylogone sp. PMI_703]|nr:hypothetical protein F5884DRAFT_858761 [Xylogone sp. PMI_703]
MGRRFMELLEPFDEEAYRAHVRTLSRRALHDLEARKTRQLYAASFKVVAGTSTALYTYGITLLGTALGARQYYLAERELAVIHGVMAERGWAPREEQKRDLLLPLAGQATAVGVRGVVTRVVK